MVEPFVWDGGVQNCKRDFWSPMGKRSRERERQRSRNRGKDEVLKDIIAVFLNLCETAAR